MNFLERLRRLRFLRLRVLDDPELLEEEYFELFLEALLFDLLRFFTFLLDLRLRLLRLLFEQLREDLLFLELAEETLLDSEPEEDPSESRNFFGVGKPRHRLSFLPKRDPNEPRVRTETGSSEPSRSFPNPVPADQPIALSICAPRP